MSKVNSDLGNELSGILPEHYHSVLFADRDAGGQTSTSGADPGDNNSGTSRSTSGTTSDVSGITVGSTLRPPSIAVNFWKRMGGYTTVTFQDYNGSIISQREVAYPSTVTPPAPPSHSGMTFYGWNTTDFHVSSTPRTITAIYTYSVTAAPVRKVGTSYLAANDYGYITATGATFDFNWTSGALTGSFYSYVSINVTLTATPRGSHTFVEWRLNNATYSTDPTITISGVGVGSKEFQAVFQ